MIYIYTYVYIIYQYIFEQLIAATVLISIINHFFLLIITGDYLFRDTPSAPMDLEAAIVASRFITLRWSPPQTSKEPILGYSIFYKQENSERERVLNSTKGNLEEINIQGLSPGGSYLFRVVALNQHGLGSSSSTLRVSTQPDLDVPGPISGLEAKATTSFSILVSWSSPKQPRGFITKYKLYYRQVCI